MVGQPRKIVIILMLLVLVSMVSSFSAVASAEGLIVKQIAIDGLKHIDDALALSYITNTKVGEPLSEEAVEADRQALFESGYFWSVEPARVTSVSGGVRVVFSVVENPVVSKVTIENDVLPVGELAAYMKTRSGKVLNVKELSTDLNQVIPERALTEYGIPVRVADAVVSPDNGTVKIVLEETRLNEIIIEGNEKTKDFVILRELGMESGDIVNINQLNKGLHRVLMLGYFDEVSRQFEPTEDPDKVNLRIKVKERKTGVLSGGVGYSSNEGFIGYIDVADENFLGKGQTVNFRWEFGKTRSLYSVGFYEPYVDSKGTSLGANIYRKSNKYKNEGKFEEVIRTGGDVTLGRPLSEITRGYLTTRIERIEDDEEKLSTHSVRLSTVTNTSNHPFFPTSGYKLRLSTELAGYFLGGDNDYTLYEGEYSRYIGIGKTNHTLAVRLAGGVITGEPHEADLFRVGGSESVRGYDYGDMSGNKKLVLNAEYRFPIKDAFHGVVFADAGNAWSKEENINLGDLEFGYGLGLRIDTPLGVMRFDYGWGDGDGNFYFSIGQMF